MDVQVIRGYSPLGCKRRAHRISSRLRPTPVGHGVEGRDKRWSSPACQTCRPIAMKRLPADLGCARCFEHDFDPNESCSAGANSSQMCACQRFQHCWMHAPAQA